MVGRIYVGDHLILLYLISKLWALWFQRRRFLVSFFFHYKSVGANEAQGVVI